MLFSQAGLKLFAYLAMTLDHIAEIFPLPGVLSAVLSNIGMIAMPLFAKFIAEGFRHTKSISRYLMRLALCGIPSHFAFIYAFRREYLTSSAITTLFLALLALCIWNARIIPKNAKIALIIVILIVSYPSDWSICAVLWALAFDKFRRNKFKQIIWFVAIGFGFVAFKAYLVNGAVVLTGAPDNVFGFLLAIPPLVLYNGKQGRLPRLLKRAGYLYYPMHLIALRTIAQFFCEA